MVRRWVYPHWRAIGASSHNPACGNPDLTCSSAPPPPPAPVAGARSANWDPRSPRLGARPSLGRGAYGGLELPLKVVQARLGHASIQMAADTYGHLFPRGDDGAEMAAAEKAFLG
jgi:hypothetical protein